MLAADKLQLQSTLKQQATALKEKEFNLHHNNFSKFLSCALIKGRIEIRRVSSLFLTLLALSCSVNHLVTVGTQAAVLAGLDVTMFIEFQPPPNSEWVSQPCGCTSHVALSHHVFSTILVVC